jgi:hypothetical protein
MMDEQHLRQLNIAQLHDWLRVDEKLLEERARVMSAIPECPEHGHQCVPHALEWIEEIKAQRDALLAALKTMYEKARHVSDDPQWMISVYDIEAAGMAIEQAEGET